MLVFLINRLFCFSCMSYIILSPCWIRSQRYTHDNMCLVATFPFTCRSCKFVSALSRGCAELWCPVCLYWILERPSFYSSYGSVHFVCSCSHKPSRRAKHDNHWTLTDGHSRVMTTANKCDHYKLLTTSLARNPSLSNGLRAASSVVSRMLLR